MGGGRFLMSEVPLYILAVTLTLLKSWTGDFKRLVSCDCLLRSERKQGFPADFFYGRTRCSRVCWALSKPQGTLDSREESAPCIDRLELGLRSQHTDLTPPFH